MPKATAHSYAKVIQAESQRRNIDPFTIIVIINHESHWRAGATSRDGHDIGLGQVRAMYVGGCLKMKSLFPNTDKGRAQWRAAVKDNPTPACKQTKRRLMSGTYNIRRVATAITEWRKTCRKVTKRPALFKRWLHGYGGMGRQNKRGQWVRLCGQTRTSTKARWWDLPVHKELRRIINHRKRLIRQLKRHRRKNSRGNGRTANRSRRSK